MDRIYTIAVLHVGEVDNAEATVVGQRALLAVLAVLVEEIGRASCRERV